MGRLERIIGTNIITCGDEEIRLGHTWHEIDVIEDIINLEKPERFVEVGVHEGGLSYLLIPAHPELIYLGIELDWMVTRSIVRKMYADHNQHFYMGNCFDAGLLEMLSKTSRKMIYCDGGNKSAEVLAYKHVCNPGDLIFCHDYYDGKRKVREVPVANISIEVKPEDIEHMETSPIFERYPERFLDETRIIGWRRI